MSNSNPNKAWQELYKEALFEIDKTKAAERIAHAEQAIAARARSLFAHPDNASAERNALDAAFHALCVLKLYSQVQQNPANKAAGPVFERNARVAVRQADHILETLAASS